MASRGEKRRAKRWWALGGAVAACALGVALVPSATADEVQPYIIGGHDSTEDYPFMVSLQDGGGRHFCGGSLIEKDWVVTAAHCAAAAPQETQVRVGSPNHDEGGTVAKVSQTIVHPEFDEQDITKGYDIALLKLDQQVPQEPISIAEEAGPAGSQTRILGWGMTCDDQNQCPEPPKRLQEVGMKLLPADRCNAINAERELCIDGTTDGTMACFGDSGGPQLKGKPGEWELIGATSRDGDTDPKCATGPGIYTDVTVYRDWIEQNTAV